MPSISTRTDPLLTYILRDSEFASEVEVTPTRGGMVTRFRVADTPILAMDDSTLFDLTKNVRGGIPILFPIAGPLKDNLYTHNGTAYEMKQHGFARNSEWAVIEHSDAEEARLTLALTSSEATRKQFPFDFRIEYTYALEGTALRIEQNYTNRSAEALPLHCGFHPYFFAPDSEKAQTKIETAATRAFDNVTKKDIVFTGFDLTQKEVDLHLYDHGSAHTSLTRPGSTRRIEISASPEYSHWVVWTLAGKDFVCVEPWTAPANALNSGQRLLLIEPGQTRRLEVQIALR